MKIKRRDAASSTHPKRYGKDTGEHKVKPTKERVSIAGIFKQRSQGGKVSKSRKAAPDAARRGKEVVIQKPPGRKQSSKPTSISKPSQTSEQHPLVQDFKSATTTYKTHLLTTATTSLDETYTTLTHALKEATLYTVAPGSPSKRTSVHHLTLAEKIHHELSEIHIPFSQCRLIRSHTDENGNNVTGELTIEAATSIFTELSSSAEQQMQYLQERWERIVGEIWKCGVQVLGEEEMSCFLASGGLQVLHEEEEVEEEQEDGIVNGEEDAEDDALFVPVKYTHTNTNPTSEKHSTALQTKPKTKTKVKKQVSFQEPPPDFLDQPSVLKTAMVPLPNLCADAVDDLERQVDKLGAVQVNEFNKLDHEYRQWWDRKYTQLQKVMEE